MDGLYDGGRQEEGGYGVGRAIAGVGGAVEDMVGC